MGRAFGVLHHLDVDNGHMDPKRAEEGEDFMGGRLTRKGYGDGIKYRYADAEIDTT